MQVLRVMKVPMLIWMVIAVQQPNVDVDTNNEASVYFDAIADVDVGCWCQYSCWCWSQCECWCRSECWCWCKYQYRSWYCKNCCCFTCSPFLRYLSCIHRISAHFTIARTFVPPPSLKANSYEPLLPFVMNVCILAKYWVLLFTVIRTGSTYAKYHVLDPVHCSIFSVNNDWKCSLKLKCSVHRSFGSHCPRKWGWCAARCSPCRP